MGCKCQHHYKDVQQMDQCCVPTYGTYNQMTFMTHPLAQPASNIQRYFLICVQQKGQRVSKLKEKLIHFTRSTTQPNS